ncbi:MAG: hypothetical protein IKL72_03120 [Firmicutes bacterium]|nr:hypothetical protein [Bacillota bacterium]
MRLTARETVIFGMLGAVMYASKLVLEVLPNIHLLGAIIIALTVVYRKKALYPIYVFVFLTGLLSGFAPWWVAYLYIWTLLWGAVMLLPKNLSPKITPLVYMVISAAHGFLFGILYAPAQAILFGLNFEGMIAWIIAGLPFDMIHGVSNFLCGILICPLITALNKAERYSRV